MTASTGSGRAMGWLEASIDSLIDTAPAKKSAQPSTPPKRAARVKRY
jgi:hypothetical protein